jgi:hypothetical protein
VAFYQPFLLVTDFNWNLPKTIIGILPERKAGPWSQQTQALVDQLSALVFHVLLRDMVFFSFITLV